MLEFMRKQAKSWLMKTILILIIIVFIGYFGYSRADRIAQTLAKVEGTVITYSEYNKKYYDLYEGYRRYLGGTLPDDFLKKANLKKQALDSLINLAIVKNRADELGISASDDEVRGSIFLYPAFQRNGTFDPVRYREVLREYRMTPEEFEKAQRDMIINAKLESLIKSSARVSDQELRDIYELQSGKINIDYLKITPKDFINQVKSSDAELEKFLKENGDRFRVPEKVQARYIFFAIDDYKGPARVTDEDINEYYSFHKDLYAKAGEKSLTTELKEKIVTELKLSKANETAAQEAKKARDSIYQYDNMDDYAKKNHLNVQQTGFFEVKNPPAELTQIKDVQKYLIDLKKDELSPIMTTPRGFYLLKIVSIKSSYVPALSDVREEVSKKFIEKEARKLAEKEAEDILAALKKGAGFEKTAQSKGLKSSATGFFVPDINIPKIGSSKDMARALYLLSAKKPYADSAFNVDGDYIVIRFIGREPIDEKDFEAKKPALRAAYLRNKESSLYETWISDQKEALKKKGDLKEYKQASEL